MPQRTKSPRVLHVVADRAILSHRGIEAPGSLMWLPLATCKLEGFRPPPAYVSEGETVPGFVLLVSNCTSGIRPSGSTVSDYGLMCTRVRAGTVGDSGEGTPTAMKEPTSTSGGNGIITSQPSRRRECLKTGTTSSTVWTARWCVLRCCPSFEPQWRSLMTGIAR